MSINARVFAFSFKVEFKLWHPAKLNKQNLLFLESQKLSMLTS